jgi:hypothetical protein
MSSLSLISRLPSNVTLTLSAATIPYSICIFFHNFIIFRHLRHLVRSAEQAIANPPSVAALGNGVAAQGAEIKAIKTQLSKTTAEKDLDYAKLAEEKDGRLNEE